jgi:hypothetical protein
LLETQCGNASHKIIEIYLGCASQPPNEVQSKIAIASHVQLETHKSGASHLECENQYINANQPGSEIQTRPPVRVKCLSDEHENGTKNGFNIITISD